MRIMQDILKKLIMILLIVISNSNGILHIETKEELGYVW